MEKIYFISDFSEKCKKVSESMQISSQNIISYQSKENESGYHIWLNGVFKSDEIEKIIIPLSLSNDGTLNTDGLLVGLHIRLNYELPSEKRLIPIIFLSNFSIENIIKKNHFDRDNNPQNLVFTKGVYFSSFILEDIKSTLEFAEQCPKNEYHQNVLSKLNIRRKSDFGGHDIANAWGCFKLSQVIGIDNKIFEHESIAKHLKQLYAKYLICENETFSTEKRIDLNPIKCSEKNILFIDDKSDEGWADLMQSMFKGAKENFVFVDSSQYKADDLHKSFKNFEGYYKECQSHIGKDWDLIIIDLRLNPEKEDIDNELISPTEFLGYKLIDEFLNKNQGYQIIVSTASNKIWNINAALERGAASYYVKESPAFNYSISETNKQYENLKKDVQKCFNKKYLFKIYEQKEKLIEKIFSLFYDNFFKEQIKNQLNLAYYLLSKAEKKEQFAYAFVSLYMIIETINNQFVVKSKNDSWVINITDKELLDWSYDKNTNTYINTNNQVSGNKPPEWQKMAGLYYQSLNGQDHKLVQTLYHLITKRNGFVHNDYDILNKTKKDNAGNNILDKSGESIFLNHDIYEPQGFINLFEVINKIIGFL